MKKIVYFAAMLPVLASAFACNNTDSTTTNLIQVSDIEYVVCSNTAQNAIQSEEINHTEQIKCYAADNATLRFEQLFHLNCCTDSLRIASTINNDVITINEMDYGEDSNCICISSVKFNLTNLTANKNYTLAIKRNGQVYYTCDVLFDENCNFIFTL